MAQADPPDNVVRFPREWFGSTDELAPIGRAVRSESAAPVEDPPVLAGTSFWTGDSWALQDALEGPAADAVAREPTPPKDPAPHLTRAEERPRRPLARVHATWAVRRPPSALVLAAALVVVFAMAVGLANLSGALSGHPRLAAASTNAGAGLAAVDEFTAQRFASPGYRTRARVSARAPARRPWRDRRRPARVLHRHSPLSASATTYASTAAATAPPAAASGSYTANTSSGSTDGSSSTTAVYSQTEAQSAFGATGLLGPGHSPNG